MEGAAAVALHCCLCDWVWGLDCWSCRVLGDVDAARGRELPGAVLVQDWIKGSVMGG